MQIPRNMYLGALAAIAVFLYLSGTYFAQLVHGTSVGVTFGEFLGMALGAAAVGGLIVWGLIAWVAGRFGADKKAQIRLRGTSVVVIVALLGSAAGAGSMVGIQRNNEHDDVIASATAAKSARERAIANEQARLAALSPEQAAAEKRDKEFAAAKAKKADEAAAEAKAAQEHEKNLRLVKQALVLQSLKSLRESMKDPDTFQLKEVLMMESGSGCITYRARNSFGAALQSHAVLSVPPTPKKGAKATGTIRLYAEGQDGFSGAWNRSCAHQSGDDFTLTAKGVLQWE